MINWRALIFGFMGIGLFLLIMNVLPKESYADGVTVGVCVVFDLIFLITSFYNLMKKKEGEK